MANTLVGKFEFNDFEVYRWDINNFNSFAAVADFQFTYNETLNLLSYQKIGYIYKVAFYPARRDSGDLGILANGATNAGMFSSLPERTVRKLSVNFLPSIGSTQRQYTLTATAPNPALTYSAYFPYLPITSSDLFLEVYAYVGGVQTWTSLQSQFFLEVFIAFDQKNARFTFGA